MYLTVKYLVYFLEYLSDENVGKLLYLFYGRNTIFKKYKSSKKELLLNILLNNLFPMFKENAELGLLLLEKDRYIKDVLDDTDYWHDDEEKYEYLQGNTYAFLNDLFGYDESNLKESKKNGNEIAQELAYKYHHLEETFNDSNYLQECLTYIVRSIESYKPNIPQKSFKTFLNKFIEYVCRYNGDSDYNQCIKGSGYCYIINDTNVEKITFNFNKRIEKETYPLKEINSALKLTGDKNNTVKINYYNKIDSVVVSINKENNKNIHAIRGVTNFRTIQSINKSLDKAIDEYKNKEELLEKCCPICNPTRLNRYDSNPKKKVHFTQMCENCKKIFRFIRNIGGRNENGGYKYTTKRIREFVKLPNKIEEEMPFERRKARHYEKIHELIRKIIKECKDDEGRTRLQNVYKTQLTPFIYQQFNDKMK